jgi:hypothetical protein
MIFGDAEDATDLYTNTRKRQAVSDKMDSLLDKTYRVELVSYHASHPDGQSIKRFRLAGPLNKP